MTRFGPPIERRRDGRYALHLDPAVRAVLRSAAGQMVPLLTSEDPAARRLYPPAYVADGQADAEREYRGLVDGALQDHHRRALTFVVDTADAESLSAEELDGWLSAIESLRLVIGTRLDVSEETVTPPADDPRVPEFGLYDLLGALQACIIDVLAADLPDEGRPEGTL